MRKGCICRMVITILIAVASPMSFSADNFEPYIKETTGSEVCELGLEKARKYFHSSEKNYPNLSTSSDVSLPLSNQIKVNRFPEDRYSLTDILTVYKLEFENKDLIYVNTWGWFRYERYTTVHLLEMGKLDEFIEAHKKEGVDLYVRRSPSIPFRYNGKWYVDDGDQNSRTISSISSDKQFKQECLIIIKDVSKVFETLESLSFVSAYHQVVKSILLAPWGHTGSGTSKAPLRAADQGRKFIIEALIRPWAVTNNTFRESGDDGLMPEYQREHMEGWQYQDVWSHREYVTYEMLGEDAREELRNYYIDEFSYPEGAASSLAQQVIDSIVVAYYSLSPLVVNQELDKNFSYLEPLTENDFSILTPDKLSTRVHQGPALSLVLDAPGQFIDFARAAGYWSHEDDGVLPKGGLLNKYYQSYYGKDMLMYAAHMNNLDAVQNLVEQGWPVDKLTENANGFPYYPSRNNRSALTYAVENGSLELIHYLIEQGADIYVLDSQRNDLDFYLFKNPNFSKEQKEIGLKALLESYDTTLEVKPGFSCNGKLRKLESLICNNPGIAIYDRELNKRFRDALKQVSKPDLLRTSQKQWLRQRNKTCGLQGSVQGARACLASTSRNRLRYFEYLIRE
jgi:uncharacterized protein YecT (DUF1311 family)